MPWDMAQTAVVLICRHKSLLWPDRHRGSVTVLYQPRREGGVECMALSSFESGRPGESQMLDLVCIL